MMVAAVDRACTAFRTLGGTNPWPLWGAPDWARSPVLSVRLLEEGFQRAAPFGRRRLLPHPPAPPRPAPDAKKWSAVPGSHPGTALRKMLLFGGRM